MVDNGNGALQVDVPESLLHRGGAMQQVRTQFTTAIAVQQPRKLEVVRRRLTEEASLAGDDFFYGWGAGENAIEGPSVKLALAAVRNYGNCAVDTLPVQDLGDSWIFTASFIDLETGFTISRQFRQSKKWQVHGRFDAERKDDIRFQIGQSKAIRNVVLNAIPAFLVEAAIDEAKHGARDRLDKFIEKSGIAAAQDLVMEGLKKVGVKEEAILARVHVAERKALLPEHILMLRANLKAIQDGQDRSQDLFPVSESEATTKAKEKLGGNVPAPAELFEEIEQEVHRVGILPDAFNAIVDAAGAKRYKHATKGQAEKILAELRTLPDKVE